MTHENWKRIADMLADIDAEIELLSDGYQDLGGLEGSRAVDHIQNARLHALAASVVVPYPRSPATGA